MKEPKVLLVIQGGVLQGVYTSEKKFTYRLIDLDEEEVGGKGVGDYEADQTNCDIDEETKRIIGN